MGKPGAFLDSSVLIRYLNGEPNLEKLFSPSVLSRVTYAVNPVVYQEILLAAPALRSRLDVDALSEVLTLEQIDADNSAGFAERAQSLRNTAVHTNDLLALGSSKDSDYLLTYDGPLISLASQEHIQAITPDDFLVVRDGVAV